MAATTETKIWLALKSRIETIPLAYQKAYAGEKFTPPSSGGKLLPYLRIGRVSANPSRLFIADGGPYDRNGFIIITLVYPLSQDQSVYDQLAGQIAEHFRDDVKMPYQGICVSVPSYPHVVEGYEDNGYWSIPVRIPWRVFA